MFLDFDSSVTKKSKQKSQELNKSKSTKKKEKITEKSPKQVLLSITIRYMVLI